jgi:HEAT repeat protein
VLAAFADWRNPRAIQAIEARTESDNSEVRKTALIVLGQIGDPAEASVFLNALRKNRSAEEATIALKYLENLEGPEVDAHVLQALAAENETANRVRLIRLVSARGLATATAELLRQARTQDIKVSIAALGALGTVAGVEDLPALIVFTRSCTDEAVRGSAAGAIIRLCQKTGNLEAEEALLTPEVEQARDPEQRATWLGILVKIGSAKALPFLRTDLQSASSLTVNQAKQMLETMAATVKDDGLRKEANAAAAIK